MKKIPETFGANNYQYRLVMRSDKAAIYEQIRGGEVEAWEVHQIRIKKKSQKAKFKTPDGKFNEVTFQEGEYLAGRNDWGEYGWSYVKYEKALEKFHRLNKDELGYPDNFSLKTPRICPYCMNTKKVSE